MALKTYEFEGQQRTMAEIPGESMVIEARDNAALSGPHERTTG